MSTKSRKKTSINITPQNRVKEFGNDYFYVDGGMLWCKVCNVPVNHVRRQTIVDHIGSNKQTYWDGHQKRKADGMKM